MNDILYVVKDEYGSIIGHTKEKSLALELRDALEKDSRNIKVDVVESHEISKDSLVSCTYVVVLTGDTAEKDVVRFHKDLPAIGDGYYHSFFSCKDGWTRKVTLSLKLPFGISTLPFTVLDNLEKELKKVARELLESGIKLDEKKWEESLITDWVSGQEKAALSHVLSKVQGLKYVPQNQAKGFDELEFLSDKQVVGGSN
jgi:hypothetical protein